MFKYQLRYILFVSRCANFKKTVNYYYTYILNKTTSKKDKKSKEKLKE